jgi:predicted nucleic acid-binding protein
VARLAREWLRGSPRPEELRAQEALFSRRVPHARGREIELVIAATAIIHDAVLWTLNPRDFADIPGLRLAR